ncbi:MAG: pilus assembly protein [Candidatus Ancillula sp.]|jgi:Flp pilus assembly protein TadG|nr:pilus assembly protein [Candidatus Ancillula sp.]
MRNESGAVAAEFALLIPVVVAFIGLILALGQYLTLKNQLQNAANSVTREAISLRGSEEDVVKLKSTAVRVLGDGFDKEKLNVDVKYDSGWVTTNMRFDLDAMPIGKVIPEAKVEVTAHVER